MSSRQLSKINNSASSSSGLVGGGGGGAGGGGGPSLSSYLLSLVNTDQRWEEFRRNVLVPSDILARAPSTGDVKYRNLPIENRPMLSDVDLSSLQYGSSSAIELLSIILHVNFQRLDPPDILPVANDFEGSNFFARYLSILKPVGKEQNHATRENESLIRFWDKFYPYFVPPSKSPIVNVAAPTNDNRTDGGGGGDPRFYDWSAISGTSEWSQKYTPLQFYRGQVAGSKLNNIDTLLDENTIYKMSWLQDYLGRMRSYRERIVGLASALKERDVLSKRLQGMREKFVKRNTLLTQTLQESLAKRDSVNSSQSKLQTRFLQSIYSLYQQYLRQLRVDDLRLQQRRRLAQRRAAARRSTRGSTASSRRMVD